MAARETGQVLILSGPPGAGKTAVAKALAPLLGDQTVYIEGDTFWGFIRKSESRDWRENFRVIMRSMTAATVAFGRTGFTVLLDFSVPPEFLTAAKTILKEVPLHYAVLRPSLEVCEKRAAGREAGKIEDYAGLRNFYARFEVVEGAVADDTATVEELANRIHAEFREGKYAQKQVEESSRA